MKGMKALSLAALMVVIAVSFAFAQGAGGAKGQRPGGDQAGGQARGQGQGEQILNDVLAKCNLTDDQKQKVEQLKADLKAKMQGMARARKGQGGDKGADKGADKGGDQGGQGGQGGDQNAGGFREAMQNFIENVKGVLNEDQLKIFNQEMAARRGGMGRGGPGGAGAAMGGGLPGVNLATMDDLKLTDEQKDKVKGLIQKFVDEQKQLIEKYQALVREMMTPDQVDKFDKMLQEQKTRMTGAPPAAGNPRRMGGKPGGEQGGNPGGNGEKPADQQPGDAPPPPPQN